MDAVGFTVVVHVYHGGFHMQILLGVGTLDAAAYLDLVRKGKSPGFDMIMTDTARTFKRWRTICASGLPLQ